VTTVTLIPGTFSDKEDAERVRGQRAAHCFWHLLAAAKEQVDGVNWYALGLAEAEAALEAWENGTPHGFFRIWETRKGTVGANRPAPPAHEREARRMVLLLCIALERTGLNKRNARKRAARELEHAGVFVSSPSHRALEHWQADLAVTPTPNDELLLATAIATAGLEPHRLARFFIGLAHLIHNPAAIAVRESEPP
jgi:hypothetical protein